ncbi:aminopeptidase P N-terminal domain-containing protein [Hymenobacter cellulosilyticus]|uniref:Xaa-Pro aminopeptidase n=1 Tax=Hymenobacter cellulosilyticus TaxID=2932248 RepID=A0A8T9QA40_9BACT|nr:aminopeptidase P N-terminal domain-containing protein [Hymenobacter cellulosilyticus]UOQ72998.1 aminopeptidase P N-terminal domain-containing protein [Hymenobacter cellulosilyticus]
MLYSLLLKSPRVFLTVALTVSLAGLTSEVRAQRPAAAERPTDFLDPAFHRQRRELLRQALPARSVAVFFAAPVRNRANDVDFIYHQDPDFYYLTGYTEPHAVLVLFKEPQTIGGQSGVTEALFTQPRDPQRESWTGRRLGAEGQSSNSSCNTRPTTKLLLSRVLSGPTSVRCSSWTCPPMCATNPGTRPTSTTS